MIINKKISAFSIIIVFVMLTIIGIAFIKKLPISLNPNESGKVFQISWSWPDASPEVIEQEVTSKLEGALNIIQGIKKIESVSNHGNGYILLTVDKNANTDYLRFEIASKIRQVKKDLPIQVSYPQISFYGGNNEEKKTLISYSLSGSANMYTITKYAKDNIQNVLANIKGVHNVNVYGVDEKEIVIGTDYNKLKKLKINKTDILSALNKKLKKENIGYININNQEINIRLNNNTNSIEQIKNTAIKINNTKIIRIKDIANVTEQEKEVYSYYRVNGKNSVNIVVYPEKNTNNIELAKKIDASINTIKSKLPDNYFLIKDFDSTIKLKKELNTIYSRTALTILILLFFVLITSKSIKYTVLIVISLIVNIAIAIAFYYLFKVQIHLYSLAGITVSLGIIIDNSIVTADYYRNNKDLKIITAIIGATFTTIASLIIIFFLDEKLQRNLIDFASIIVINLMVSIFVSLLLIPALVEKFKLKPSSLLFSLKRKKRIIKLNNLYKFILHPFIRYKKTTILIAVLGFGLPVYLLPNNVSAKNWYGKLYNYTLGNDYYTENIKPYVNKILGGSLRLFTWYVFEGEPQNIKTETKLYVNASMPEGATVKQLNEVFLNIENYLTNFTQIQSFITNIYSANYGSIEITFKPEYEKGAFPYLLKNRLIAKAIDYGGMNWDIYGVGKGFSNSIGSGDPVNYKILVYGYNYDELNIQAEKIKNELLKHPRIKKVNITGKSGWFTKNVYYYKINIDKHKLQYYNINNIDIYQEIKQLTKNNYPDINFLYNNENRYLKIQTNQSKQFDMWELKNYELQVDSQKIKLNDIATITKEKQTDNITRENQQYIRTIKFEYMGSSRFGDKYVNSVVEKANQTLPIGYKAKNDNVSWIYMLKKSKNQYWFILLIIFLIFLITSILFESFKLPLSILFMIPISFIGVFLTFYLFDVPFDKGGFASFILLSGITVNSAIFIVNDFKQYSNKNIRNYMKSFNHKIIPIILTIFSTILGLLPFIALGEKSPFWYSLASGTIGGLLFSLLALIIFLPVVLFFTHKTSPNSV